jgi:ubiquinone/menaquinone biosynthesis C-methylase UbiE
MAHLHTVATYDRLQPAYDRMHRRFLAFSGAAAQGALEGAVMALARPGLRILDAGCGTGRMARRLLDAEPASRIVLLDPSPAMLAAARDLPVRRVHGSLAALPFADAAFDLSLVVWSLEPVARPQEAIGELLRVTRPGGVVGLAFCAASGGTVLDRAVHGLISLRRLGRPLCGRNVSDALTRHGATRIRRLPGPGGAMALIAWKGDVT